MSVVRKALLCLFALLIGLVPARSEAKDPVLPKRKIGIAISGNNLLTTFSFGDAFSDPIKEKLSSGLPTRLVIQINLEQRGNDKPIAYWARSTNIVYDLWEENYIVSVEDKRGRRQAKADTAQKAMVLAGALQNANMASITGLPAGIYRLRVAIEVNPVSKEMVENIRRWLSKPPGGKSGTLARTNFFGSFVGIFVDRRIGKADYRVAFVSQDFRLGKP